MPRCRNRNIPYRPLTISLNLTQRLVLRDFLSRATERLNIYYATSKRLRAGRSAEVALDDLGRTVDALAPLSQRSATALRMAEAEA